MTLDRLAQSPIARRLLALALLGLAFWMVAPLFTAPLDRWREGRAALQSENNLAERLARLGERRAAVSALAGRADPPFLIAADADAAAGALARRIFEAVPAGALRIDNLATDPADNRPGAPVRAQIAFTATQGALYAFLSALETRAPLLKVEDLIAAPRSESDGTILLTGTATVAAVALLRAQP